VTTKVYSPNAQQTEWVKEFPRV